MNFLKICVLSVFCFSAYAHADAQSDQSCAAYAPEVGELAKQDSDSLQLPEGSPIVCFDYANNKLIHLNSLGDFVRDETARFSFHADNTTEDKNDQSGIEVITSGHRMRFYMYGYDAGQVAKIDGKPYLYQAMTRGAIGK